MTPTAERWVRRMLAAAATAATAIVVTTVLDLDPEPVRLVLLSMLVVAAVGLLGDVASASSVAWYPAPTHPPVSQGRDQATQTLLRHLESHHHSRHPDASVRDRLAVLADQVLLARHGVPAHCERGRALLGPDLVEVLTGPVVRLNPRRMDRLLRKIEEL